MHGVDLAEEGIRTAIELNKDFPKGSFKVGDASKCDHLASGSFDKACSVDVIEHCGHDVMLDIFGEAHRLLKTGRVVLRVHAQPEALDRATQGLELHPEAGPDAHGAAAGRADHGGAGAKGV